MNAKIVLACLYLSVFGFAATAQTIESSTAELLELNLEDLMNIKIVSASKKSESVFDAPFASSVLSKDEIKKAGCTSIMEAFKLMPGLIVREQTNGNYDIHIRGLDNVPPNSVHFNSSNSTTLVMIDNRPVYNYLQGGTFWETLPIDINDVDKIEIVRGPTSAMYGPNAVSGVINIITRKTERHGVNAVANAQYGSNNTKITNATVGYQFSSKLNMSLSGNYQNRDRAIVEYYRTLQNDFTNSVDSIALTNQRDRYPNPKQSMNKYAANGFINYAPLEKVSFNASFGTQNSQIQNAYQENQATPLSTRQSNTQYGGLNFKAYNFSGNVSYLGGNQNPDVGTRGSKYDFNTMDAYVEYEIKINKFVLKPGYNFRQAIYDDTKYWDASKFEGAFSGRDKIVTNALSLRSEYKLFNDKLRLFGGARVDKFNYPDKYYFSYQLAGNYYINDKNLIRLTVSKANRSSFIYDTFLHTLNSFGPYSTDVTGNQNLKLVTSHGIELGYRSKLASNITFDMDVFAIQTTNYTEFIQNKTQFNPAPVIVLTIENLPVKAQQLGTTISVNAVVGKLQVKPFVTLQTTRLKDYTSYYNLPDIYPTSTNPNPAVNNYLNGHDVHHKGTPAAFGGAYINYTIGTKFNINLNPYFYSAQTFYHRDNASYADGMRGVGHINPKLLLNARLSYKPVHELDVFVSGKNILGDMSREYYNTDRIGFSLLAGLNFQL